MQDQLQQELDLLIKVWLTVIKNLNDHWLGKRFLKNVQLFLFNFEESNM